MSDVAQVEDTTATVIEQPQVAAPSDPRRAGLSAALEAAERLATPSDPPPAETQLASTDANGREHGPDGKFLSSQESPAAATPQTDEASAAPPPNVVTIPLEADHPLRAQGITEIPVDAKYERALRSLLNNPIRQKQVEELNLRERQLKTRVMELEAEAQGWREQSLSVLQAPEIAARYAELKEWDAANGTNEANRWLRGVQAEHEDSVGARQKDVQARIAEMEAAESGQEFIASTYHAVREGLPAEITSLPVFNSLYQSAMDDFDNACQAAAHAGTLRPMTPEQARGVFFSKYLLPTLSTNPYAVQAWSAANQGRANLVEKQKADQAAAEAARTADVAARHQTKHPLGNIPSHVRTDRVSTQPETADLTKMSPDQIKKYQMQRLGLR